MPRRFSSRVEATRRLEFAPFRSLALHAEDGDRLMAAVRNDDEPSRFVNAHPPARVERRRERGRNRPDRLDQSQRRPTLEPVHVLPVLRSGVDLGQKFPVDFEDGDLRGETTKQMKKSNDKNIN